MTKFTSTAVERDQVRAEMIAMGFIVPEGWLADAVLESIVRHRKGESLIAVRARCGAGVARMTDIIASTFRERA
jgi:hypothetical protein